MSDIRRCLGCQATYPPTEQVCPKCGSHAAEVEEEKATTAKGGVTPPPKPKRKT